MTQNTLILASGSPRRRELLEEAGLAFEVAPAQVEELVDAARTPEENARDLACQKAQWTAGQRPGRFVLGADTLVVLDGEIIGKPRDGADAKRILTRLSGRPHQVITGVAVIDPAGRQFTSSNTSTVVFKPLVAEEIDRYVESGEPMDKAGAYAIQGQGAALVASWSGSYSNIVGLPMETVKEILAQAGYSSAP